MDYVKIVATSLKNLGLNEAWVQERISEDPSILGLGELKLKDKERTQPSGGRLDILLQDSEDFRRYEVEIQLGATDPSHIIRTLEYWDRERKRYPQYEHTAVLVAEDVTARFLNVISLFNGSIPVIAVQMKAIRTESGIGLFFTKVLDEVKRGLVDEDEDSVEATDRDYWLKESSKGSLEISDALLAMVRGFEPNQAFKYNKFYIGLARDGKPNNFMVVRPKRNFVRLEVKLKKSAETDQIIDDAGLEVLEYDSRWGAYKIRLTKADVESKRDVIVGLMRSAYDQWTAT